MANIVIMPKQGLQMTEGLITKWLKNVGDTVKEGEPLFEMETDKLTITIDSSFTGTLLKIIRGEGEEVPITEPIAPAASSSVWQSPARSSAIPVTAPPASPLPQGQRRRRRKLPLPPHPRRFRQRICVRLSPLPQGLPAAGYS